MQINVINPEKCILYGEEKAVSYTLPYNAMVYRHEHGSITTPMTPHKTEYSLEPFSKHKYLYLYVVEQGALSDLTRLRQSQNYFNQPTVLRADKIGDLLTRLGPKAKVLEDYRFNGTVLGGNRKGGLAIVVPY